MLQEQDRLFRTLCDISRVFAPCRTQFRDKASLAPMHLSLDHLMPVDMALHDAATVPRVNRCLHCVYRVLTHRQIRAFRGFRWHAPSESIPEERSAGSRWHGNEVICEPLCRSDGWRAMAKGFNKLGMIIWRMAGLVLSS